MTITLQAVNELIQSLESAGELSIKERKYLDLAKAYADKESESVAQALTFEKCRELSGCPAGVDLQDWVKQLAAERDAALNAERVWETAMMEVCGEDGPASVANEIRSLRDLRDTAIQALKSQVERLAAENAYLLNGAARELNTSWMFSKTMLGAQAALVCLAHGYQAAAREWLEGTTDEAVADIPDDITVGELHEWFESQMVSNDGKSGFLTRAEAEEAIRKTCSATDRIVAGIKADGATAAGDYLKLNAQHMSDDERLRMQDAAEICYGTAARLREGADK